MPPNASLHALQARARSGQAQATTGALEQCQAEVVFQQFQLPADRAVGDMQVPRAPTPPRRAVASNARSALSGGSRERLM